MSRTPKNDLRGLTRGDSLKVAGAGAGAIGATILGGCSYLTSKDSGGRTNSDSTSRGVREYALAVAPMSLNLGGRKVSTWGFDGSLPRPEIRLKEDDTLCARVGNKLPEGTTVHWHGLPIVNKMDGIPGVTQPPIGKNKDFSVFRQRALTLCPLATNYR